MSKVLSLKIFNKYLIFYFNFKFNFKFKLEFLNQKEKKFEI